MKSRFVRILPIAGALALAGCDGLFGPPDRTGDLFALTDGVEFLVREFHGPVGNEVGNPELGLYMATPRTYPCLGHAIEAEIDVSGDVITVDIAGVREPPICVDQDYPAEFREMLEIGEGEWTLRFIHGEQTQELSLVVDATEILVSGGAGDLATPRFERFWRYPVGSFAVGCEPSGNSAEACEEMFDSVAATPGVTSFEFGADGGIPYPVSYSDDIEDWSVRYWMRVDEAAWQAAVAAAGAVAQREPGLRYFILDWRNRHEGNYP